MSTRAEIANLNRAALAAHEAWGANDPRSKAISAQIAKLREKMKREDGDAAPGYFAKTTPTLIALRAADEAALKSRGGLNW